MTNMSFLETKSSISQERWRDYIRPSGTILAEDVSYEDFMVGFPNIHAEWVDGVVIEMSGIDERHDQLTAFLRMLFAAYLELSAGGRVLQDPMLMKLPAVPSSRAPDLQVLLPESLDKLQHNQVIGPADLVVEVVSRGSWRIDTVEKFLEYERGGVPEYWLIDPRRDHVSFFTRSVEGEYQEISPDTNGIYQSTILPKLRLNTPLLWREKLPRVTETLALVQAMLAEA
jgi:Uma2 family endonuclease